MADETLSLVLRVLGVEQAARETGQAALSVEQLGAAARAANAGVREFDLSAGRLGTDLRKISVARLELDTSGLKSAQAQMAGIVGAGAAMPPLRFETQVLGAEAAAAQMEIVRAEAANLGATMAATRQQMTIPVGGDPFRAIRASAAATQAQLAATGEVAKATGMFSALGQTAGSAATKFLGLGFAATAVGVGVGVLIGPLAAITKEAAASEEAIRRFDIALSSLGQFSTKASAGFQNFAAGLQAVTSESDEAIMAAGALLAQVGRLGGEELQQAVRAALDLSAVLGTDLQTAALQLSKAAEGNVEALQRIGIVIDESVPKGERFAAVLKKVETNMGGAAVAQANTYAGAVAQLKNAWSDFLEAAGKPFLSPLTGFFHGLAGYTRVMTGVTGASRDARTEVDLLAKDMVRLGESSRPFDRLGASMRQIENKRLPTIEVAFKESGSDEIKDILEEIGLLKEGIQIALPKIDTGPLDKLRAEGEKALQIRLEIEEGKATEQLHALDAELQPKTLPVTLEADFKSIDADLASLRERVAKAPVELSAKEKAESLRLVTSVKAELPKLDAEQLQARVDEIGKKLQDALKVGTAEATRFAVGLAPAVQALRDLAPAAGKKLFEAPALEPLQGALEKIREIRAELGAAPPRIDFQVSTADVAETVAALQSNLRALAGSGTVTSEQLEQAFEAFRDAVRQAEKEVPALKDKLEGALKATGGEIAIRAHVLFDTEEARRDAQALGATAVEVLRAINVGPIELLDAETAASQFREVSAGADMLGSAVRRAVETQDVDKLTAAMQRVGAAEIEAGKGASAAGDAMRKALAEGAAQLGAAMTRRGAADIFAAREGLKTLDLEVRVLDLPAAEADLVRIQALVQATPGVVPIELRILAGDAEEKVRTLRERLVREAFVPIRTELDLEQAREASRDLDLLIQDLKSKGQWTIEARLEERKLRREIAKASRFSREAGELASKEFEKALGDAGFDALAGSFEAVLNSMLDRGGSFGDAMKQIFASFVDEALKQLARLAAAKFLGFLGNLILPGSGGIWGKIFGAATGREMSAGSPGEAPSQAAQSAPILLAPEVRVEPRLRIAPAIQGPVELAVGFAAPEAVELPAPVAKIRPMIPVTISPAVRLAAASIAALAVTPRIVAREAAAIPVAPEFQASTPAPIPVQARLLRPAIQPLAIDPELRLGALHDLALPAPPLHLTGLPREMTLAAPGLAIEPWREGIRLPAPAVELPHEPPPIMPRIAVRQPAPVEVQPRLRVDEPAPMSVKPDLHSARQALEVEPEFRLAKTLQALALPAPSLRLTPARQALTVTPEVRLAAATQALTVNPRLLAREGPAIPVAPDFRPSMAAAIPIAPEFRMSDRQVLSVRPGLELARKLPALSIPAPALRLAEESPPVPVRVALRPPARETLTVDPNLRLGALHALPVPAPAVRLAARPPGMTMPAPPVAIDRWRTPIDLPLPDLRMAAPSKAGPEPASTRATLRVPMAPPPDLQAAALSGPLREATRAFAAAGMQRPLAPSPRPTSPIARMPQPPPTPAPALFEPPSTASFLRQRAAIDVMRRPTLAGGIRVESGSDLVSRFSPRGQMSGPSFKIETPDPVTFQQQLRRGPLGRAVRSALRSGRI